MGKDKKINKEEDEEDEKRNYNGSGLLCKIIIIININSLLL